MNELTCYVGDQSCLYWTTEKASVSEAIEEMFDVMEQNNIGNDLIVTGAELRDANGDIIDEE